MKNEQNKNYDGRKFMLKAILGFFSALTLVNLAKGIWFHDEVLYYSNFIFVIFAILLAKTWRW